MKLKKFETYEEYVEAQRKTLERRGSGPYFTDMEIEKICDWIDEQQSRFHRKRTWTEPKKGICHGARNGLEADEFKKHFKDADIFGTDLFPFSGRSAGIRGTSNVIEWDFSKQKPEWVNNFDFVYSNSLDHVRDPIQVLNVWLEQLKSNGHMFLQWSKGNTKVKQGDCFGSTLWEVMDLLNSVGILKDLIYINCPHGGKLRRRALEVVILVVGKKEE